MIYFFTSPYIRSCIVFFFFFWFMTYTHCIPVYSLEVSKKEKNNSYHLLSFFISQLTLNYTVTV